MLQKERPWLKSYPKDVPASVDCKPFENLNDLFEFSAHKYATHSAYVNMNERITYANLALQVERFASFLQNVWHLKKGDKIAIMMPNLLQYPIAVFGALKAGLIVVNVNPLYTPRELETILQSSEAKAIAVIANYAFNLQSIISNTKIEHVLVTDVGDAFGFIKGHIVNFVVRFIKKMVPSYGFHDIVNFKKAMYLGSMQASSPVLVKYEDIAFLQFTGGTTGKPKGAMLSHGNLIANIAQAHGMYGSVLKNGCETIITAIPLYHVFALTINCLLFTYIGANNILITDPRNVSSFLKDLETYKDDITCITGVNTLFNMLINNEKFKKIKFSKLSLVVGGGAQVQSGVAQGFYDITGHHILEGYGLTECSPLCAVCPHTTKGYTGSIGLPIPSTDAIILDPNGNEIWDLDKPGELLIKGPQVMQGYYNNQKASEFVMDGDYIKTGDIAIWMEGGFIKLIDRIKDMILVSGFNVFPSEIEDVVSKNNKVLECAAIGIPSHITGEAVRLIVVKKDPKLTKDELIEYCREFLTPYKIPHSIIFTDNLPKSAIGKVLRRKLRELYTNG